MIQHLTLWLPPRCGVLGMSNREDPPPAGLSQDTLERLHLSDNLVNMGGLSVIALMATLATTENEWMDE